MPAAAATRLDDNLDDASLLELSATMPEAFGLLVERHQSFVFGAAFRVTRNPSTAEDIAQEAFLRAFRTRDGFRGDGSVRGWLYRIAHNLALNNVTRSREVPTDTIRETMVHDTPEWHVLRNADKDRVRKALNQLPEALRTALVLREYEESSYEDIAGRLGIPVNTVRSRIHRGRKALEELLQEVPR